MRTLIAFVSMVLSGSSLADTVRHLQVPERFWGTWARSPDLCRDKKSIIVVSEKGYVTPEASCEFNGSPKPQAAVGLSTQPICVAPAWPRRMRRQN